MIWCCLTSGHHSEKNRMMSSMFAILFVTLCCVQTITGIFDYGGNDRLSNWNGVVNDNLLNQIEKDQERILRKIYSNIHPQASANGTGCKCINYNCGCCVDIDVPEVKLNDTGCVNVSYLPDQYGFSVTFTMNKFVLLNITMSAKNPPPVCFGIPYLEKEVSLCLDFYNMDYTSSAISGCIRLEIHLVFVPVVKQDIGCFRIPLHPSLPQT